MNDNSSKSTIFWQWLVFAALVLVVGCRASWYGKAADEEVYGILDSRRQAVLGETNQFGKQFRIGTDDSHKTLEDVNGSEIVRDRYSANSGRFWGTNSAGVQQKLTLEKALELAVKANRTYQLNMENVYLEALALTGTRHQFALQFTGSVDLGLKRVHTVHPAAQGDGIRGTSGADLTMSKALKTGGVVTATLANDLVFYFSGNKPKTPDITISLAQPLLGKNAGTIAAEILTQAERDVIYEVRDFSHYQKTFAVEIVSDYYSLLQQGESLRLTYNNYLNSTNFTWEMKHRVGAGLNSEYEAKQALESEFSSRLEYIGATNTYKNSLDDFKQKLSLPLGEQLILDFSELDALKKIGLPPVDLNDRKGYRLAITNRLDIMNEVDKFEDSKRKVKVARHDLLPSLQLVADASLKNQFYSTWDFGGYDASGGLKLDLPLDKLTDRNAYRQSLIYFERQLRTLATQLDVLRDGVRSDVRNLARQRENYFTQQKAEQNAQDNLKATRERLKLGFPGVRTRDIITARSALLNAQQEVSRAIVEYQNTRLKLLNDVGILDTSVKGFWMKDQPVPGIKVAPLNPDSEDLKKLVPPDEILLN